MHRANLPNRDTANTRRRCGQRRLTALYTRANQGTNQVSNQDTNPVPNQDTNQDTNQVPNQVPNPASMGRQMLRTPFLL